MSKPFADAILTAEQHSTHKEKHAALSGMDSNGVRLVVEALNPYRRFHVKKFDKPVAYATVDADLGEFFKLLDQLHARTITGNAARAAVTAVLGLFTQRTAAVLERVLIKDLDCGASSTTFEKLYPGLKVPCHNLGLAVNQDTVADVFDVMQPNAKGVWKPTGARKDHLIAEVKYDGHRGNLLVENGGVTPLSRGGRVIESWEGRWDAELAELEKMLGYPFVLDGEAMGADFRSTSKSRGKDKSRSKDLKFYAFDLIPLTAWKAEKYDLVQSERSAHLEKVLRLLGSKDIIKSEYRIIKTMAELNAWYKEVLKLGQEGLILKDPNGVYVWDRSPLWIKYKPYYSYDLKITGWYYGNPGSKYEKMLGGFELEGVDAASGKYIKTRCGGGLSDKQRVEFLAAILSGVDTPIGKTAEIEGKELSLAENATVWAVREPVFVQIRDDK